MNGVEDVEEVLAVGLVEFGGGGDSFPRGVVVESYTQKLWMRVKRKAAYLPGW